MNKLVFLCLLILLSVLFSCSHPSSKNEKLPEVWKSEFIRIKSTRNDFIDSLKDHSQYLHLYESGKAILIDSLNDGVVRKSNTTWEIREKNQKSVFLFGYGQESKGILGIAYPIVLKNETDFKMSFDSTTTTHIWNLKRAKN